MFPSFYVVKFPDEGSSEVPEELREEFVRLLVGYQFMSGTLVTFDPQW